MSRVALTGANGFLGWHTRLALREQGIEVISIPLGKHFDLSQAVDAVHGAIQVIHLAGVNRGTESEVADGNIEFAIQLAEALSQAGRPPAELVYANSTQTGNGSTYGQAKLRAGEVLAEQASRSVIDYRNVVLPNLFGEHGVPFYNAVTATFCHMLATGDEPTVDVDKELTLLHAQNAADFLIGTVQPELQHELEAHSTVSGLLNRLTEISQVYATGEIPDLSSPFIRDLFNTYRSYLCGIRPSIALTRNADERGSFFEIVRSNGGAGQTSFSTTVPGIIRGEHFHRRKVERFTVLSGRATIALRKMFTNEVVQLAVSGDEPVAVDMPTGWSHNITNTGDDVLYTSFWSNEVFDPARPDTIPEAV